jgi:hypothetical protein
MMISSPLERTAKRSTNVRLSHPVYDWLHDYAHDEGLSQSEVIESVLQQFMEEHPTTRKSTQTRKTR